MNPNKLPINAVGEEVPVPQEWPPRPQVFPSLMTAVEACQYLRLDQTGIHTPDSAVRTLKYFRDRGQLKATKYARHVWFRREELDEFLKVKTEEAQVEKDRREALTGVENVGPTEESHDN